MNRTKVLVVDDDRRMARTICDILKIKKFDVIEAQSGEEAIEYVLSDAFDCVLMDIKMTGIDGIETLKRVKDRFPGLPVILMSGYATAEQTGEARRLGACAVLSKPIDIRAVLAFLSLLRKERNILIVDDDPEFSRTFKDILKSRGYEVETETNPENVMECMDREYRLAVLLDLKLGDRNGTEVLQAIHRKYPTKPVILVTGYGKEMSDSVDKGLRMGAYGCLYKPIEIDELIRIIDEIDRKKLQALLGERVDG